MLFTIGISLLEEERITDNSLACRISVWLSAVLSQEYTVVSGVVAIFRLIVGASAMHWGLTGELLCNVPPSVVESFFTVVLINGHNIGDRKRRVDLHNVYAWRMKLIGFVEMLAKCEGGNEGDAEKVDAEVEVTVAKV